MIRNGLSVATNCIRPDSVPLTIGFFILVLNEWWNLTWWMMHSLFYWDTSKISSFKQGLGKHLTGKDSLKSCMIRLSLSEDTDKSR